MSMLARGLAAAIILVSCATSVAAAQEQAQDGATSAPREAMTVARIARLIEAIDPEAEEMDGRAWQLKVEDRIAIVVTDAAADRMRIMTPVAKADHLGEAMLKRLMQANYDTALDARYALAQDILWGVFIHPLSSLDDDLFLSGLGQTINVARNFGTTFSSGALSYGGGDSQDLLGHLLIEQLKKKGSTL